MTDTNMRRDFEAFANAVNFDMHRLNYGYSNSDTDYAWIGWQAATDRAANLVEAMTERRRMNSSQKPGCEYAAAIRQGDAS